MAVRHFAQISTCIGALALGSLTVGCASSTVGVAAPTVEPADTRVVTRVESASPVDAVRIPTPRRREKALRLAVAKLRVAIARVEGRHLVTSARARALSNRLDSVARGLDMLDAHTQSRTNRLDGALGLAGARVGVPLPE